MTDDRVAGTTKKIGDQVEEGFRRATGDLKMQVEDRRGRRKVRLRIFMGRRRKPRPTPRKRSAKARAKPATSSERLSRSAPTRPPRSLSASDS